MKIIETGSSKQTLLLDGNDKWSANDPAKTADVNALVSANRRILESFSPSSVFPHIPADDRSGRTEFLSTVKNGQHAIGFLERNIFRYTFIGFVTAMTLVPFTILADSVIGAQQFGYIWPGISTNVYIGAYALFITAAAFYCVPILKYYLYRDKSAYKPQI